MQEKKKVLTYLQIAFNLSPCDSVAQSKINYRLNGRYFQMITRWAFLGLISTNRDGPLHSAAETVTSPPTPSIPPSPPPLLSLHHGFLYY